MSAIVQFLVASSVTLTACTLVCMGIHALIRFRGGYRR